MCEKLPWHGFDSILMVGSVSAKDFGYDWPRTRLLH